MYSMAWAPGALFGHPTVPICWYAAGTKEKLAFPNRCRYNVFTAETKHRVACFMRIALICLSCRFNGKTPGMRNNYSTSILSRKSVFRILKLLCFSLALGNTAAEEPAFDSHIEFHTFPADFGYRAVRTMLQDHKGLLWFGSENGLIRFDGDRKSVV